MTTESMDRAGEVVSDSMAETRKMLSVRGVFGEAYQVGDRTIIPVARVGGGAGGGGGDDDKGGGGFGSGFGMGAVPVGVYEVNAEGVEWKPAVDVNRLAKGGQILAGIIAVCVTLILVRRH